MTVRNITSPGATWSGRGREDSAHRRQRRSRTRSRTLLRNYCAGLPASREQVVKAVGVLREHNSLSRLPEQALIIMNQGSASWYCSRCKQWCKGSAAYCGSCGAHWTSVQGQPSQWQPNGWDSRYDSPHRSASPRRRQKGRDGTQAPWRRAQGGAPAKGNGAWNTPKGEGKGGHAMYQTPQWQNPAPPWTPSGSVANQMPNTVATASGEGPQIQELVCALKSAYANVAMPPDIADMVSKAEGSATKQQTKDLHYYTSQLGAARKQLQSVRAAMMSQETAWTTFLQNTAEAVEKGGVDHAARMSEYGNKEEEALQKISAARRQIRTLAATSVTEVSDGSEPELMETETAEEASTVSNQQAQDKLRMTLDAIMAKLPAKDTENVRERTPRRKEKVEAGQKPEEKEHPM